MTESIEDIERILAQPKVVAYAFAINPEPWAVGNISAVRNKQTGAYIPRVSPELTLVAYQEALRGEMESQGVKMKLPAYSLRFHFSRQLARYIKSNGSTATRNWADVTNMQKATEDALEGVLIGNDRDVWATQSRLAGTQGTDTKPYVVIELGYGIEGFSYHELDLPHGISDAALDAIQGMYDRLKTEEHIVDNKWEP